jgi:hypothetical protein
MRALVGCLNDRLVSHREDAGAYSLLVALTQETLKRSDSPNPSQREFDAQDQLFVEDLLNPFSAAKTVLVFALGRP